MNNKRKKKSTLINFHRVKSFELLGKPNFINIEFYISLNQIKIKISNNIFDSSIIKKKQEKSQAKKKTTTAGLCNCMYTARLATICTREREREWVNVCYGSTC